MEIWRGGICTSQKPSPYPIEKVGDFPYPYSYPCPYSVNAEILRQNGMSSGNTHEDGFICHISSISKFFLTEVYKVNKVSLILFTC